MEPTQELREELRAWISERIPPGKTDADTLFTDKQLDAWLLEPSATLEEAAYRGWLIKAGEDALGGIIERTVGSERLRFAEPKDRRAHALAMADYYFGLIPPGGFVGSHLAELDPPNVLGVPVVMEGDISRLLGY